MHTHEKKSYQEREGGKGANNRGGRGDLELASNTVTVFVFEASLHFLIFLYQRDELFYKRVVNVLPRPRLRVILGPVCVCVCVYTHYLPLNVLYRMCSL